MSRFILFLISLMWFSESHANRCVDFFNRSREVYSKVATQSQGEPFTLKVKLNGKPTTIEGYYQNEIEHRIIIPAKANSPVTLSPSSGGTYKIQHEALDYRTLDQLVDRLIYFTKDMDLAIQPLASRYEAYHSSPGNTRVVNDSISFFDSQKETLTSEIKIKSKDTGIDKNGRRYYESNDVVISKYVIGRQIERSTYFDTADMHLSSLGVAVRIKEWSSMNKQNVPAAKKMFVKTMNGRKYGVQNRHEFMVDVPLTFTAAETKQLMTALLQFVMGKDFKVPEVDPVVALINQRTGLNLMYKGEKVGFVTIDKFKPQKVNSSGDITRTSSKNQYQMEFEIVPNEVGLDFLTHHLSSFTRLIKKVEAGVLGSFRSEEPKYLTAMNALSTRNSRKNNLKEAEIITPEFLVPIIEYHPYRLSNVYVAVQKSKKKISLHPVHPDTLSKISLHNSLFIKAKGTKTKLSAEDNKKSYVQNTLGTILFQGEAKLQYLVQTNKFNFYLDSEGYVVITP